MATIIRNLIQYNGIDTCRYNTENFKQVNVSDTFCIPIVKPDIEQIVKVWSEAEICNYEIVKTPVATSLEGQILTGYKLVIMGNVKMKFEYVALEKTQSVHTAHTIIPFCGYIVLPKEFNPIAVVLPNVSIEDIHVQQLGERCIYSSLAMLLSAEIC